MRHRIKLLIGIVFLMATACIKIGAEPLPSPPCPIESLLLDESFFHSDIHRTGPPSRDAAPMRFGVNRIGVGFTSMTQGGATQDVYQARSTEEAQKKFADYVNAKFSAREGWTEWYIPDAFNYQSSVADQFRFGCYRHEASDVETCQAVGQYDVYLIRFYANMSSILTYRDLERMLQAIDNKVAQCLAE
jgi:hypothetical protein